MRRVHFGAQFALFSTMGTWIRAISIVLILGAYSPLAVTAEAELRANDSVFVYCLSSDSNSTAWYSEVFQGTTASLSIDKYSTAFGHFVEANYSHATMGASLCFYRDERGEARSERDQRKANETNKTVVQTSWTY